MFEVVGRLSVSADGDISFVAKPEPETFQPLAAGADYQNFINVVTNLAREISCVDIENTSHAMQAIMEHCFIVWVDDLQIRKGMENMDAVVTAFNTFRRAVECMIDDESHNELSGLTASDDEPF